MVELSLRTRMAALMAARGPFVKAIIAACGTYVNRNMNVVTPRPRVMVGANLETRGFHKLRWERK